MFKALGVDLPSTGTVFSLRTVIVSLLLGVGITVLATISPARRATRVPPIAAVREGATLPPSRLARSRTAAPIVLGIAAVMLAAGLFADLPTVCRRGAGRSGMPPPVHRRRHDLVAPGAAARGRRRGTRRTPRRSGRRARQGQRHPQSRSHGSHGRRADDRARAGHARRDVGGEPQGHHQGRAEGSGARGLRRDGQERLRHVHLQRGARAGERAWSGRRLGGARRQGEQLRHGHRRHGSRPVHDRQRLRLPLEEGLGQRAAVARLRRGDRQEPVRGRQQPRRSATSSRSRRLRARRSRSW